MGSVRIEKVQELIKQEASEIIMRELKDPRIGFVTITEVDVSSDLHNAKLYVSILGSDKQIEEFKFFLRFHSQRISASYSFKIYSRN